MFSPCYLLLKQLGSEGWQRGPISIHLKDKSDELLSKSIERISDISSKIDPLDRTKKLNGNEITTSKSDAKATSQSIAKDETSDEIMVRKTIDETDYIPVLTVKAD